MISLAHTVADSSLPEILEVLAHELDRELSYLLPEFSVDARGALALDLADQCRRVGGNRLPTARGVAAPDLPGTDPAYGLLFDAWVAALSDKTRMPDAWVSVATYKLLEVARTILGNQYVPKGRSLRSRDDAMWQAYRGNCRATGIEFGISSERVRQIVRERARDELNSRQGDLFGDVPDT